MKCIFLAPSRSSWYLSSRLICSDFILNFLYQPFLPKPWGISRGSRNTLQHSPSGRAHSSTIMIKILGTYQSRLIVFWFSLKMYINNKVFQKRLHIRFGKKTLQIRRKWPLRKMFPNMEDFFGLCSLALFPFILFA